jgi:hypothetical protein
MENDLLEEKESQEKLEKDTPTRFTPKKMNEQELQNALPVAVLEKKFSEVVDAGKEDCKTYPKEDHKEDHKEGTRTELSGEEQLQEPRRDELRPTFSKEGDKKDVQESFGNKDSTTDAASIFQATTEIPREYRAAPQHKTPTTASVFPSAKTNKNISSSKTIQQKEKKEKKEKTPAMTTPYVDEYKLAVNPGSGEVYYYNRRTRVSQWDPPAPAVGVVVNMHEHPHHSQGRVRVERRDDVEQQHTLEKAAQQQEQPKSISASFSAGRRARTSNSAHSNRVRSVTMRSREEDNDDGIAGLNNPTAATATATAVAAAVEARPGDHHLRSSSVSNDGHHDSHSNKYHSNRRPPDTGK